MKSFKQYLNEFANKTGDKEHSFMSNGYLPLSPSLLKDFEKDIDHVYHVTDMEGLQKIVKLQGRRVDIATFTRGSEAVSVGLLSDPEVLVELEGKTSITFNADVHSAVDRNGIRWLKITISMNAKLKSIVQRFSNEITDRAIKAFDIPKKNKEGSRIIPNDIAISNWLFNNPKEKRKFIKWYFDNSKNIMNKKFITQLMNAIPEDHVPQFARMSHNEVLLHNFKIIRSRLIVKGDTVSHGLEIDQQRLVKAKRLGMHKFKTINFKEIAKLK